MKYVIVSQGEGDSEIIDCSPSELEKVIEQLIKNNTIKSGDRIYSMELVGRVETKIKFEYTYQDKQNADS